MDKPETFKNDQLTIRREPADDRLRVVFSGKSILRDPSDFVLPILLASLDMAIKQNRRLYMDFRELSYMNSSTFTPVIKLLERARLGEGMVTAVYKRGLKWQEVSFSALTIFRTSDGRIEIVGEE